MPAALPESLRAPITDMASATAWLDALVAADLTFHLEDDPAEIVNCRTDEPTFLKADHGLLRERVGQLYAISDWGVWNCPIGYLLAAEAVNGKIDFWTARDQVEYSNGQLAEVVRVGVGPDRHRAILKCSTGFMVASKTKEQYAEGDFSDDFEEREELFPSVEEAMADAGGLWE